MKDPADHYTGDLLGQWPQELPEYVVRRHPGALTGAVENLDSADDCLIYSAFKKEES